MKAPLRLRFLVPFVVFLFLGRGMSNAETNDSHAAAALFQRFETVFHSQTSLLTGSKGGDFIRAPFAFLLGSLEALEKQAPNEVLDNAEAVLVGTKDYSPPKSGLGMVRSTFCYILVLRDKSGLNVSRYFKRPISSTSLGPVWHWSAALEEFGEDHPRPSSLYAAQIAQSYVLVSNNLEEIEYLAASLRSSADDNSRVLARLHEWEEVGQHKFWGYRRFKQGRVPGKSDFTTSRISLTTDALTVYADSREGMGVLRVVSSSPDDKTAENLNAAEYMPRLAPRGPGIWQATIPLTQEDKQGDGDSIFLLCWLFGFGAII